ncbi:MAG: hypothetical protein HY316_05580 [Acidobacteria bacterium]|nr:hypothetical protein [Acidobacteriota bacterium]
MAAILAAAMVLSLGFGARAGLAQSVSFNFFGAPTLVANTGDSEVLGQVILSGDSTCGTAVDAFCISTAGSIQITYTDMVIDNSIATGITVCEIMSGITTCNAPGIYLDGTISVGGSLLGGVVSFGIKAGANFAAGDQVRISGVRARISQTPLATPGNATTALLTAAPVIAAGFSPTAGLIARSADPLAVSVMAAPLVPCVAADPAPVLEIVEEYSTAFVDHGDPGEVTFPGVPVNARPLFGATNSSRIRLTLTGLVDGISVRWPATVPALSGNAVLDLVSQSESGSTATYAFGTPDQAASDVVQELFDIQLDSANFTFSGNGPITGNVTVQGQMAPPASPVTARPRYNHPLQPVPAAQILFLRRCNTTTGSLTVRANVDGLSWSGGLGFQLSGPTPFTGTKVPVTLEGMLAGTYTIDYLSGGPSGATFVGYVPTQSQTLIVGGTRLFTVQFFGPTNANLQLTANSTPVCPSEDAAVGSFQMINATEDLQIIPGGTRFSFTFSSPIVGTPTLTGLGSISPVVAGATMSFEIPGSISLPPGGALTFSATRLNLGALGNGQNVTVQFASTPSGAIRLGSNLVTVATTNTSLCTSPPVPAFTAAGVVNGASFLSGSNGISPGSIGTIFGTHLSNVTGIVQASTLPLQRQLAGVSVTVNGNAVPLFAVANVNGQEQINFQVPWEVLFPPAAFVTLAVNNNGLLSTPVQIPFFPVAPGLFTVDGTIGAIQHGVGSAPVTASDPALPGEVVVLYATGLGVGFLPLDTGAAAPLSPPIPVVLTPTATVAGLPATVQFAGFAPGFVGLYQINVLLPSNVPSGSQDVGIQMIDGLAASKPVKIAIR